MNSDKKVANPFKRNYRLIIFSDSGKEQPQTMEIVMMKTDLTV
jgi:hypothetical protein